MARTACALALALAALAAGPPQPRTSDTLPLSSALRVVVLRGRDVALEVRAKPGEDYRGLARQFCGDEARAGSLSASNGDGRIVAGDWVRLPLALLSPDYRSLALRHLFPEDRREGDDWLHVAKSGVLPTYDEGLWQVAVWFTGGGEALDALRGANGLTTPELNAGQIVRVPAALLHPAFHARERSADGVLEFATDAEGAFAAYRLRPGEAVYTAVVVRFTGRTAAEDVAALSDRVAERSGISDVRDIPAGYEIKIPLDLLEPEFLPADHPRRLELEARKTEMARELEGHPVSEPRRRGLAGVLVILDPGHGGRDMGTMQNGVWEHDYVYDVTCRLKAKLEERTSAQVVLTLEDLETGCAPSTSDQLVANRQGTILTEPPFLAREQGEADIGVNLRWYLANSILRKTVKAGGDADRVVFLSIHADSRHPSLRGVMVYVPGAAYRTKTYGDGSAVYTQYQEVREKPHIQFSKKDLVRSEAVSRSLAGHIVGAFRGDGLPVQSYQPVRDKVIRGKSRWVPAVLRGNAVPAKALVELLNLANADDAALLGSARVRDRLAEALLQGILSHFGESGPPGGAVAAAD